MVPMGRMGDALRALRRHASPCRTCEKHIRVLTGDWLEYELTLNSYMEKMNAWAARQAKRDRRAVQSVLGADPQNDVLPENPSAIPLSQEQKKANLRARVFGGAGGVRPGANG